MRIVVEIAGVSLLLIGLSGCVDGSNSGPVSDQPRLTAPRPAPVPPRPTPIAPPATTQTAAEWVDRPISNGDWNYRPEPSGSAALFGASGQAADFIVRCDRAANRVLLSRGGATVGSMTVRATSGLKSFATQADAQGSIARAVATLAPQDTHLDAMIFSRGRFLISANNAADLIVPAWPEIARVVEDCRPAVYAAPQ
jgi:hypothetical protein